MKKFLIIPLFLIAISVHANNFSAILKSIEENSYKLQAERKQVDASIQELKANNSLQDPEIGANYLWGNNNIGNRLDLNVTQGFDFPTVYIQRNKLVKQQKKNVQLSYLNERQALLLQAHKLCLEVVYCNAMLQHLATDVNRAQQMESSFRKRYNQGEATAIEYNKVKQSMVYFQKEYLVMQTHRDALLTQLKHLNGNNDVVITDSVFCITPLSNNYEQWLAGKVDAYPAYQLALGKQKEQEQQLKLARQEMLPGLKLGYMLENEKVDRYQGVTLGLTIPLWKGKKHVNAAKKQIEVAEWELKHVQSEISTQLQSLYNEALGMQNILASYNNAIVQNDNNDLLQKALNAGTISIITYLEELQWGHEMTEKQLELQWQYADKMAELLAVEL